MFCFQPNWVPASRIDQIRQSEPDMVISSIRNYDFRRDSQAKIFFMENLAANGRKLDRVRPGFNPEMISSSFFARPSRGVYAFRYVCITPENYYIIMENVFEATTGMVNECSFALPERVFLSEFDDESAPCGFIGDLE